MKITFLQAFNGDSILINFKDQQSKHRNILIDGGPRNTYEHKDKVKGKIKSGNLKLVIESIKANNQKIDLLILTHVDEDHIGGIIRWFERDSKALDLIEKVWFNSGNLISEFFEKKTTKTANDKYLPLKRIVNTQTSIKQGIILESFIQEKEILHQRIIKAKEVVTEFGLIFLFLSPDIKKLKLLSKKWEIETSKPFTFGKKNDYGLSLKEHLRKDKFEEDTSVPNSSSIAFILVYNGKNMLFLGDAQPTSIIDSLKYFGYSNENPLKAEFVKVSHHGSKANTNLELLGYIDCKRFIISSNGNFHSLPDKQCLARIIAHQEDVVLYFNYPEKASEIFSEVDFEEYKFTILPSSYKFIIV